MLLRHSRRTTDDRADLGVRTSVDFVQQHDIPLNVGELRKRRFEPVAEFERLDIAQRIVAAGGGRRFEKVGIADAAGIFGIQRAPTDDLPQPRTERRAVAALFEPFERLYETVLHDILGVHGVAHHGEGHGVRGAIVPANERVEGRGIAGAAPSNQFGVGYFIRSVRIRRVLHEAKMHRCCGDCLAAWHQVVALGVDAVCTVSTLVPTAPRRRALGVNFKGPVPFQEPAL